MDKYYGRIIEVQKASDRANQKTLLDEMTPRIPTGILWADLESEVRADIIREAASACGLILDQGVQGAQISRYIGFDADLIHKRGPNFLAVLVEGGWEGWKKHCANTRAALQANWPNLTTKEKAAELLRVVPHSAESMSRPSDWRQRLREEKPPERLIERMFATLA